MSDKPASPKQFWFNFKIGDNESVSQDQTIWLMKNGKHDFHTIEYSAFTELQKELDAYKKAKAENDERFMNERDEARAQLDALKKVISEPGEGNRYRLMLNERDKLKTQLAEAQAEIQRITLELSREKDWYSSVSKQCDAYQKNSADLSKRWVEAVTEAENAKDERDALKAKVIQPDHRDEMIRVLKEALKSIKCDTQENGTAEECIDALAEVEAMEGKNG